MMAKNAAGFGVFLLCLSVALGATVTVTINSSGFIPQTVVINSGDTVVWTNINTNNIPHSVIHNTAPNPQWDSSLIPPGRGFNVTLTNAGTYAYYDGIYAFTGNIVVCSSTQLSCSNACVDIKSSFSNCGGCGVSCLTGQSCSNGACIGTPCLSPKTFCSSNGGCFDTTSDNNNCGGCGVACPSDQTCTRSVCTCNIAGRTLCGTSCLDLRTDARNCGSCGNVCGATQSCTNGACTCPSGRTICGTSCPDITSDSSNCGGCGITCPSGRGCVNSQCVIVCPAGQSNCNGTCFNLATDVNNCGRCGNLCTLTQTCTNGACVENTAAFESVSGAATTGTATYNFTMNSGDVKYFGNFFKSVVVGGGQSLRFQVTFAGLPDGAQFEVYISQDATSRTNAVKNAIQPAPIIVSNGNPTASVTSNSGSPFVVVFKGTGNLKREVLLTNIQLTSTQSLVAITPTNTVTFNLKFANLLNLVK